MTVSPTRYLTTTLPSGIIAHYASAGDPALPALVLLHGFPSSQHQYRNLIPLLAGTYRVIAPDLPGFGHTKLPAGTRPTFDLMADTVGELLDYLNIKTFAAYVFDYGAPTLFRLALKRPNAIKAIVSQNGNAYEAGLGDEFWAPLKQWWSRGVEHADIRDTLNGVIAGIDWTASQYYDGVPEANRSLVDPSAYVLDYLQHLSTDAKRSTQLDIFWDYQNNITLYPAFQAYFRESQVPLLAVWGKGDPCFVFPGAEAFRADLPNARVVLLDGGHFLLETHVAEVADEMLAFLATVKW